MTAVEQFVARLRERGVTWIATLCGHGLDPFFHAARQAGLRLVDTRNEQAAGYMAEAYGRLTRRPGICAVSSGVAHVNALTGVLNAWFDNAPMLLITGAGALQTAGLGHFQDCDQVAMARPVTRFSRLIDSPERAVQILDEALDAGGPAHVTFPMDVQTAEVRTMIPPLPRARGTAVEDPEEVAAALAGSSRPLIVAGSGVYYAGAGPALLDFAERWSIPIQVPIWDRGIVDRPSPAWCGVVGAASGGPRLLADSDCLILAGAEPDYRLDMLRTAAGRVVRLDRGWARLASIYQGPDHPSWLSEARRRREQFRAAVEARGREQAKAGLHTIDIIDTLRAVLADQALLLIDGGSIGQWAHQLLCDRWYPGHWLTCGRSGVVGWGLGGAMGARLAFPDRPIVLLSGDGAFTFTVAELECACRQRLEFVAIVADDLGWGITRTGHLRQFGEPIASELGPIAFDRLAQSLGAHGVTVRQKDQLKGTIGEVLARREVSVVHVPVVGGHPA